MLTKLLAFLNHDTEWELNNSHYASILEYFGNPSIDLFASAMNAKCSKYVSWGVDPQAWAMDAFTIDCGGSGTTSIVFPPFAFLSKCLRKIVHEAEGIFVFPYWAMQPWFPLIHRLALS